MKRFKDDVREVARGYECGLSLSRGINDLREGDMVECFEVEYGAGVRTAGVKAGKGGARPAPAKAPTQRQLRVGEEIRHVLSTRCSLRGEFRDPELAGERVTVTEVRLSPDLRNATAFVARLGRTDIAGTAARALKPGGAISARPRWRMPDAAAGGATT